MTILLESKTVRHGFEPPLMFFEKPGSGLPEHLDDECEPLASVVRHYACELEADGMFAAWHDRAHEPVSLYASGDFVNRAELKSDVLAVASRMASSRDVLSHPAWCATADESAGLLTTAIASVKGVVTLTASFRDGGYAIRARSCENAVRMLPLVRPFFRLWEMRSNMQSRLRGLTAAINNSDVATLLVDREGKLLFANDAAEALIGANDALVRSGSTLRCTRLQDTLRLQAAIDHVLGLDPVSSADAAVTPVVALPRTRGRPLMAAIMSSSKQRTDLNDDTVTVYIFDPEQDLCARLDPACKLYGLSPVETRLTSMLAGGASLADAADSMHIREQTARSYLKQIFLKTGTNRQAELVWVMLKSSVRTAPGYRAMLI